MQQNRHKIIDTRHKTQDEGRKTKDDRRKTIEKNSLSCGEGWGGVKKTQDKSRKENTLSPFTLRLSPN